MNRLEKTESLSRRAALRALGAAAIAGRMVLAGEATTRPQGAPSLREKARKNLKLGVSMQVYGGMALEAAVRRVKEDGFGGVLCDYAAFKDVPFDHANPDWKAVDKIRTCFERNGIEIVALFGYFNVVDPNEDRRKVGEARMNTYLRNWKRFGCPIVSTETGTFNAESQWIEDPKNYTEAGYVACREAFKKLADTAEKAGATVAIECYWRNVIDSARRAERLLKEVDSPALKLTMDPCNYFRNEDIPRMRATLEDIFKRVGRHSVVAHAKDVKASPKGSQTPAAGTGDLDYPLFLRLLTELDKEMWLLLEHVTAKDVGRARDHVKAQFEKL